MEQARPSVLEQSLEATAAARAQPARRVEKPSGLAPAALSAFVNLDVVARHADDAPFLWLLRDRAVAAPHYNLTDLAALDERVEAHLDGLRVADTDGWRLAEQRLKWSEPGEVFAAGVLALNGGSRQQLERVLEAARKGIEVQRGLISAAGWIPWDSIRWLMEIWLAADCPTACRVALAAFAVHRQDPGPVLVHLACHADATVRGRALQAAAELGRADLLPIVLHAQTDRDEACRFFAAQTAALLGDRSQGTLGMLRDLAAVPGPYQERALLMAVRCLPPAEVRDWLRQLWQCPDTLRLAARGAGAFGDPALAGVLIELMEIESVARAAGEAFETITGADLKYLDLYQAPPRHQRREGEEGDDEELEVLDDDSDLVYPVADKIADWWRAEQHKFGMGCRYLGGYPLERDNLLKVLRNGKQRQRAATALELALLEAGQPLFEVRARGNWQQWRLGT
jgi:uncharacterized protein (TIGR02270 family)